MFVTFQNCAKNNEQDTWKQITSLQEKLETSRVTCSNICKNLKDIYESKQFNVTTKYVILQEKYKNLQHKTTSLKAELQALKIKNTAEMEKLTTDFEKNNKLQEEMGKNKIRKIQEQIEQEIFEHDKIVQQLYNELDLAQAATSLQQDELETELCKELVDINVKIRQMQKINADVQIEINDLKSRQQRALRELQTSTNMLYTTREDFENNQVEQRQINNPTPQNNDIRDITENAPANNEETHTINSHPIKYIQNIQHKDPYMSQKNNASQNVHKQQKAQVSRDTSSTKYQPLPFSATSIDTKVNYNQENKNKNAAFQKSKNVTHKNNVCKDYISSSKNSNVFENRRLKDTFICNQNAPKKRKLFNPDDLDYLNNINISLEIED